MFTKQHYEVIAEILRMNRDNDIDIIDCIVRDLSNYFTEDNPQFKPDRFQRACED